MKGYKQLDAWQITMDLVEQVYLLTKDYPKEDIFGLTSQTKRAAISVPANIAEGIGRQYKKDTLQFLHIARGSLYELETLFMIAVRVGSLTDKKFQPAASLVEKAMQVLNGLINYYKRADQK